MRTVTNANLNSMTLTVLPSLGFFCPQPCQLVDYKTSVAGRPFCQQSRSVWNGSRSDRWCGKGVQSDIPYHQSQLFFHAANVSFEGRSHEVKCVSHTAGEADRHTSEEDNERMLVLVLPKLFSAVSSLVIDGS